MAQEGEFHTELLPQLYKPPSLLPIAQYERDIQFSVETWNVNIVVGETGSGKTTQIPQFLARAGWADGGKQIAVTQPRRLAAQTVAARVATEMGVEFGQEVGYSVRFEEHTSEKTKIKFMTDGMLLQEMLIDPLLSRYSVVMVDEAHERSLSSDILLSVLKRVLKQRSDLRVVVSSATLDKDYFANFLSPDPEEKWHGKSKEEFVVSYDIEGREFEVDVNYLTEPCPDYVERAVQTVLDIHTDEAEGDILVFLTGRDEIDDSIDLITEAMADHPQYANLYPLPLYAGLTTEQQLYVFEPPPEGKRKVIFSTNIAEASVTIDGTVYVVDCCLEKTRIYDADSRIDRLSIVPISHDSAQQRCGRAGRTRPGKCFRLTTAEIYDTLEENTHPEIQRVRLTEAITFLMSLGIRNVMRFDYISNPPATHVIHALDVMTDMGLISTETASFTQPFGTRLASLPLDLQMAKALLSATDFGVLPSMLHVAAMSTVAGKLWVQAEGTSIKDLDAKKREWAVVEGDHMMWFNLFSDYMEVGEKKKATWCHNNLLNYKSLEQAVRVRRQLVARLEKMGIRESQLGVETLRQGGPKVPISERFRRCLTTGYFTQAAHMLPDGSFAPVNGKLELHVHPSSVLYNRKKMNWVLYGEIVESKGKVYIRDLTKIERDWLPEYAPHLYKIKK